MTEEEKKIAARARAKAWYLANKERAAENRARWQKANPDKVKANRVKNRAAILAGQRKAYYCRHQYYLEQSYQTSLTPRSRAYKTEYAKKYRKNPQVRAYQRAAGMLNWILKTSDSGWPSKWIERLGCSREEFRRHIESQFEPWMNWGNRGTKRGCWQIDHIKSRKLFDLLDPIQLAQFFHFSNTRPLSAKENNGRERFSKYV